MYKEKEKWNNTRQYNKQVAEVVKSPEQGQKRVLYEIEWSKRLRVGLELENTQKERAKKSTPG